MSDIAIWLAPLLFLPGVGIFVLSTSTRYQAVHDELHHLMDHPGEDSLQHVECLLRRAGYFRNALVALYISAASLAAAALLGGITMWWDIWSTWAVLSLSCLAVCGVVVATVELIRETTLSLDVFRLHAKDLGGLASRDRNQRT